MLGLIRILTGRNDSCFNLPIKATRFFPTSLRNSKDARFPAKKYLVSFAKDNHKHDCEGACIVENIKVDPIFMAFSICNFDSRMT